MMFKLHQIIFLYVLLVLSICNASNYMKCDIHDFFPCPINASCTELADGSGECRCLDGFALNENHKSNDDDYCLLSATTSSLTSSATNKDVHSNEGDKASASSESHGAPNSKHLLGGILIPVLVILLIVGVILVIKRTNLVNRVRERIFTRRNRPLYEDVMMSNDNDDPPLI